MKPAIFCAMLALGPGTAVSADADPRKAFADQAQYEVFYEFEYQANVVERLIFECTADDDVWEIFAYATAPITNSYMDEVLGLGFGQEPFTDQSLGSLLWQELKLNLTRSSVAEGDPAEPRLMAQRDVLKLMKKVGEDRDTICDFVFWEEVGTFEETVDQLLEDTRSRLDDEALGAFLARAEEGLPILRKLFAANPLNVATADGQ
jgi:hypothetical protein